MGGGERRGAVQGVGARDELGAGTGQGADQTRRQGLDGIIEDDGVGRRDHRREHLADPAPVVVRAVVAALGEQVVAEQVAHGMLGADGGDAGGDAEEAREPGVPGEGRAQVGGLGPDGQVGQDAAPPAVAGEPLQGGQHVLADRAADAGVLEQRLVRLQHPGQVADGARQDAALHVDRVPYGDRSGQVELQADHGGGHRRRLDAGDQDDGDPHRAASPPRRTP